MCGTPVSSPGSVRKPMAKLLLSSSRSSQASSAPFLSYSIRTSLPFTSGSSSMDFTVNPHVLSPTLNTAPAFAVPAENAAPTAKIAADNLRILVSIAVLYQKRKSAACTAPLLFWLSPVPRQGFGGTGSLSVMLTFTL